MTIFGVKKDISSTKMPVLPKNTVQKEIYEGSINVIEQFNPTSEVNQSDWKEELQPKRPFSEVIDLVNLDPRPQIAIDTYTQMTLGSGIRVKCKSKRAEEAVRDWMEDIQFETKLEDGLYSYFGTGNMIFEKAPKLLDLVEVDITTMKAIERDRKGKVKNYVQRVNNKDINISPDDIIHFKLTNARREVWGRGLFHAMINEYEDPDTGNTYESPIIAMKKIEDNMVKVFDSYAAPIQMFYFKDAGEQFIKTQAEKLKNMKKGAKIVTDKEFDVKTFEVNPNSKFDGYVEHLQKDIIEPGTQFPLQFFNAGFTARAASESTDSLFIRKVKRIQKRLANQIKHDIIIPYLKSVGKSQSSDDVDVVFEFESKTELTTNDLITMFRDNVIRRSEIRKHMIRTTTLDMDQSDMSDEMPITSVTPTNQFRDPQSGKFGIDLDPTDDTDTGDEEPLKRFKSMQKKKV